MVDAVLDTTITHADVGTNNAEKLVAPQDSHQNIEKTDGSTDREKRVVEEIYTVFTKEIPTDQLPKVKEKIQEEAQKTKAFTEQITTAIGPATKAEKVAALKKLYYEQTDPASMSPQEAATFMTLFYRYGSSADVIGIFSEVQNTDRTMLTDSEILQEYYAVSLNKMGATDKTIEFTTQVIDKKRNADDMQDRASGEIYAARAKAFRERARAAAKSEDPAARETAEALLSQSYQDYLQGYLVDFEYYPGVNAVYNLVELGREDEAKQLADLVYKSTQMAGGVHSTDYWCLATQLELAVITDKPQDEVDGMLDKVLHVATADWEVGSTLDQLKMLAGRKAEKGEDTTTVDTVIQAMDARRNSMDTPYTDGNLSEGFTPEEKQIQQLLERHGIHYLGLAEGPLSHFTGGNIEWGGQLHTEMINRTDIKKARAVVEALGLDKTDDLDEFNEQVDTMLRRQFSTLGLEKDLHGPEHDEYDKTVKAMINFFDVRTSGESQTNIMADMEMGLGDCRHHAYGKQLLFDVWKRGRINDLLREAYSSSQQGNTQQYQQITQEAIPSLEKRQMVIVDVIVEAPIKTNGKYEILKDEQGNRMITEDGEVLPLEDHTLNAIVFIDADGTQKIQPADAFYQHEYAFGWHQRTNTTSIPLGQFLDTGALNLGTIPAIKDGEIVDVPVRSQRTPYAGRKPSENAERIKKDVYTDDQTRYRGFEVKTDVKSTLVNLGLVEGQTPSPAIQKFKKDVMQLEQAAVV